MFSEASGNIRRKIIAMGILLALTPVVTLIAAGWIVMRRVNQVAEPDGARSSRASLTTLTRNLLEICRSYQSSIDMKLRSGREILDRAGSITFDQGRHLVWRAKNEISGAVTEFSLPVMTAGSAQFVPVVDFNQAAPIVDEIARTYGTMATVFQRMNESGDMLRVSSSEKGEGGVRAIGSYVPGMSPEGPAAASLRAVLAGQSYVGTTFVSKTAYLAAYQPLKDEAGAVVGMLYTAILEDEITSKLRELTAWAGNASSEEIFVLRAEGDERGTALIMGDKALEGRNLWAAKDSAGQPYVQEICTRAQALSPGEVAAFKYQKIARVGAIPRTVIAQFAYVPEWHWVVGFAQPEVDVLASASWGIWLLLGVSLAGTGLVIRIWVKYASDLTTAFGSLLQDFAGKSKEVGAAAAAISQEVERVKLMSNSSSGNILATAGRTSEEINLAIRHIEASSSAVSGVIGSIEQIAFATDMLAVNAAIEATETTSDTQVVTGIAEELRNLAQRCGAAARETKAAIDQSRIELQKGNEEVARLLLDLRPADLMAASPSQDAGIPLHRQTENLLRLTQAINQTLERVCRDLRGARR